MIKVLFLIHDLGQGGAEKVLINLVNNLDKSIFDITVLALFGGGVNEKYLETGIRYLSVFKKMIPANSKLMKLFTPKQLHRAFIKEEYDIEISYLEGPSSRIVSGCTSPCTRLVNWVHVEQRTRRAAAHAFRSEKEAEKCYGRFHHHVFVAETVKNDFLKIFPQSVPCSVIYNTVESDKILSLAKENTPEIVNDGRLKLISVGRMVEVKGYARLLRIVKQLVADQYNIHLFLLGEGKQEEQLKTFVNENGLDNSVSFLDYQSNPYKYVAKCDLFVCSSYREGFSTAATEALIVGTPVCTVDVSGMREMLGNNNEWGIVTENTESALYMGIKTLLDNEKKLSDYKNKASIRGVAFKKEKTVFDVEKLLLELIGEEYETQHSHKECDGEI